MYEYIYTYIYNYIYIYSLLFPEFQTRQVTLQRRVETILKRFVMGSNILQRRHIGYTICHKPQTWGCLLLKLNKLRADHMMLMGYDFLS
jgi:hypothetical protein